MTTLAKFVMARALELEQEALNRLSITHPHPDGYWLGPFTTPDQQDAAEALHQRIDWTRSLCTHRWPYTRRRERVPYLKMLAAVYSTHPDYRQEWKP